MPTIARAARTDQRADLVNTNNPRHPPTTYQPRDMESQAEVSNAVTR
jgi:hypothetical protein